uniref:Uncharacterized protein n=1 Tax=Peronospora matthiolae TaxID=2874970 RepID=A0AAV1U2X7_9STRA
MIDSRSALGMIGKQDLKNGWKVMSPMAGSESAPCTSAPVCFDAGHEKATASSAVVQGEMMVHESGDDVDLRILAALVDLQARMTQMEVSQLKCDEYERTIGAIESGIF